MPIQRLQAQIDALRARLADEQTDPKSLHDDLQHIHQSLHAMSEPVPADLRDAVDDLEAEVLEDFYDNLPV